MLRSTLFTTARRHASNQERKFMNEFYKTTFPTTYDFDKERVSQSQQFPTLDCIMDPTVSIAPMSTWKGIKKRINIYICRRRLKDRRGDLTDEVIRQRYVDFKKLCHSTLEEDLSKLPQFTTNGEAERIKAEQMTKIHALTKKGSWRQLSGASAQHAYTLEIKSFDIVGAYYGSMTNEDWLQFNYRAEGVEHIGTGVTKVQQPLIEFPVMEFRLTDGILRPNTFPPMVVAVMDRTGSRYGRDGFDAVQMRKSLQSKSWFQ
eukprot:PhF_6_TR19136/c0_g1_i1/m.28151